MERVENDELVWVENERRVRQRVVGPGVVPRHMHGGVAEDEYNDDGRQSGDELGAESHACGAREWRGDLLKRLVVEVRLHGVISCIAQSRNGIDVLAERNSVIGEESVFGVCCRRFSTRRMRTMLCLLQKHWRSVLCCRMGDGKQTLLHLAVEDGASDAVIRVLLKDKVSLLVPDRKGDLPLHIACRKWHSKRELGRLIDSDGEALRTRNMAGRVALHEALVRLMDGDNATARIDSIKWLIEVYPEAQSICDFDGYTPLIAALSVGVEEFEGGRLPVPVLDLFRGMIHHGLGAVKGWRYKDRDLFCMFEDGWGRLDRDGLRDVFMETGEDVSNEEVENATRIWAEGVGFADFVVALGRIRGGLPCEVETSTTALHVVCAEMVNEDLLGVLQGEYADLLRERDYRGWLPIHYASACIHTARKENGGIGVMHGVAKVYPDGLESVTPEGEKPVCMVISKLPLVAADERGKAIAEVVDLIRQSSQRAVCGEEWGYRRKQEKKSGLALAYNLVPDGELVGALMRASPMDVLMIERANVPMAMREAFDETRHRVFRDLMHLVLHATSRWQSSMPSMLEALRQLEKGVERTPVIDEFRGQILNGCNEGRMTRNILHRNYAEMLGGLGLMNAVGRQEALEGNARMNDHVRILTCQDNINCIFVYVYDWVKGNGGVPHEKRIG